MACRTCGGELIFRYIDGVNTPIHLSGGCGGRNDPEQASRHVPYQYESFVNPNATCPVCGASVFFYRSPNDGRVFFDELGPPWPKHPCTSVGRPDIPSPLVGRKLFSELEYKWHRGGWEAFVCDAVLEVVGMTILKGRLGKTGRRAAFTVDGLYPDLGQYPLSLKLIHRDRNRWKLSSFRIEGSTGRVREILYDAREANRR